MDLVLAVDSSACFRDQHSRMIRWLVKLVRRISRDSDLQFGNGDIRLALMQVRSPAAHFFESFFFPKLGYLGTVLS